MAKQKIVADLKQSLATDETTRKIIALEREAHRATQAAKEAKDKLKLVLSDLELAEQTISRYEATSVDSQKKFDKLRKSHKGQATAIVCLNDWHCEERVDSDTCNGLNHFNLDIAEKRVAKTVERSLHLIEFMRGLSNIQDMVVWLGGDLINGYIHEELQEGNFLGPTEAILFVQELVSAALKSFDKHAGMKHIHVVTSMGNHGRSTQRRRISTGYKTSWEWMAYNNLSKQFPNLTWQVEKGYHSIVDVQGHAVRFHHGDAIQFQGGVGGVHIPLRKKIAQWNKSKRAALDILGHFHQYADDYYYVLAGCLVGYNAYANFIGAEPQSPTQTLVVMDRSVGKVACLPIFCDRHLEEIK